MNWRTLAACGPDTARLFFGHDGEPLEEQAVREAGALAICRRCPARIPCLRHALDQPSQHGVAGGMAADQRRPLRYAQIKRQKRTEGKAA